MTSFVVHAHFFQPPRGNPLQADADVVEADVAPHQNWNARITGECYAPNAELGNFERVSFSVASTLLDWLSRDAPATYRAILEADRIFMERAGGGNAMALPLNHVVLPLARQRDKITEVRWGIADFLHRFGRRPVGMWLPEMAVDMETLVVLQREGIQFTVLSRAQTEGAGPDAGPYWAELSDGKRIGVYVRDDELSNQVAFDLPRLGGAGRWARDVLAPHQRTGGRLTLVAVDGETFGHHHRGEEQFLRWLLSFEAPSVGYDVSALGYDFSNHKPSETIGVRPMTSWSCPHGVARWGADCDCTSSRSHWKGMLRRSFERLAARIDEATVVLFESDSSTPWALRDDYIRVVLRQFTEQELLERHGLADMPASTREHLLRLLQASFVVQRAFNSAAFHGAELEHPEPTTAIAFAARAAQLVEKATGEACLRGLRRDLSAAVSTHGERNAADVLDELLARADDPRTN